MEQALAERRGGIPKSQRDYYRVKKNNPEVIGSPKEGTDGMFRDPVWFNSGRLAYRATPV